MATPHRFTIHGDHPSLPGHFPGRPVVPGVVLLELALQPILQRAGNRPLRLVDVKFLAPVLPEQEVSIEITAADADRAVVEGKVAGATVLRCRVNLGSAA